MMKAQIKTLSAERNRAWIPGLALLAVLIAAPVFAADMTDMIKGAGKKLATGAVAEKKSNEAAAPETAAPAKPVQANAPQPLAPEGSNLEIGETSKTMTNPLLSARDVFGGTDKPLDFVYNPKGKPDPMLVPWTRLRVMLEEYIRIAEEAVKANQVERAQRAYIAGLQLINATVDPWGPGSKTLDEFREKILTGMQTVKVSAAAMGALAPGGFNAVAELPSWVKDNLTGVVFSPTDPVCLIGPYTLHEGQEVPNQSMEVIVQKIDFDKVTFKVLDQTYVVNLRKGE